MRMQLARRGLITLMAFTAVALMLSACASSDPIDPQAGRLCAVAGIETDNGAGERCLPLAVRTLDIYDPETVQTVLDRAEQACDDPACMQRIIPVLAGEAGMNAQNWSSIMDKMAVLRERYTDKDRKR